MSNYVLSCCSPVDLTKEMLEGRDIKYICNQYEIDGITYEDDFGETVSFDDFYDAIREGAITKTSQINCECYKEHFETFLKEGKDILHVTLSSGLSGTFNSANIAREELIEKYPDRKLYIVDSLSASAGYGFIMETLADKRDEGLDVDELYNWIEENKLKMNHVFFSTDLTTYIRGGRVSKASGTIGNVLNICPVMDLDKEGHIVVRNKVRGKKKAYKTVVDKIVDACGEDYSDMIYISNSDDYEDAKIVSDMFVERLPKMKDKPVITSIGTIVGSHTGPGTVSVFVWGENKRTC